MLRAQNSGKNMVFIILKECASCGRLEGWGKVELWARFFDGGNILYQDRNDYAIENIFLYPRKNVNKTQINTDSQIQMLVDKTVWPTEIKQQTSLRPVSSPALTFTINAE